MAPRKKAGTQKSSAQSIAQLRNIRSRVSLAPDWWLGKSHILIDMDGTLIGQPGAAFHNLFAIFAFLRLSALASYKDLYRAVSKAIKIVLSNHQFDNNEDAFFETLSRELNVTRQKIELFAGRFFDSDYPFICLFLHSEPDARRLLDLIHATGRHVTLATNAIFGRREIELRLKASDLYLHDFDLVTSWDVMKSTKPHTAFFEETLKKIGGTPESAVMIGNDPFYDLPAHQLGIDTLLVGSRLSIGDIADALEATLPDSERM